MNHLYSFTNSGPAWSALSVSLETLHDRALLSVRCGATQLESTYTSPELRAIAAGFAKAANELERTAREQNDEWLDTIADGHAAQVERVFAEIDGRA